VRPHRGVCADQCLVHHLTGGFFFRIVCLELGLKVVLESPSPLLEKGGNMKRILVLLALFAGFSLAQGVYVGGHLGLFGTSVAGVNFSLFNVGVHAGMNLGPGLEVRAGADASSILGITLLGFSADVLAPISMTGFQPYLGGGANLWVLPAGVDFGAHLTLGGRLPVQGFPAVPFLELQPTYAFGGGGAFLYYIKVGVNYGL